MDDQKPTMSTGHEAFHAFQATPLKPTSSELKESIIKDLEQKTMDFSEALNTRNFDTSTPAWQIYAETFIDASPTLRRPKNVTLAELHAEIVQCEAYFPDFKVHFSDLSTVLNSSMDRATIFFKTALTNAPPGVTKQGMSTVEFHLDQEKEMWFCVKQTNLSGEDYVGI